MSGSWSSLFRRSGALTTKVTKVHIRRAEVRTLLEIEQSLPNGLHDAEVRKITADYEHLGATIDLAVWVGDMDDPPERTEAYKEGQSEISGLLFLAIAPLDASYPFQDNPELIVDGCDMTNVIDRKPLNSLPARAFVRSFFVKDWNSFIHIAAKEAAPIWKNDGAATYRGRREHFAPGETMTSGKKTIS
jgi:hypothetical protein